MRTTPESQTRTQFLGNCSKLQLHFNLLLFFFPTQASLWQSLALSLIVFYQRLLEVARDSSIEAQKEVAYTATHPSAAQTSPHYRELSPSSSYFQVRWVRCCAWLSLDQCLLLGWGLRRYLLEEEKVERWVLSRKDIKPSPTSDIDT